MRRPSRSPFLSVLVSMLAIPCLAQTPYKLPPREVVDILDAPPTPAVVVSPARDAMLLVEYRPYPSIDLLAQPFLRLAGLRIDPETGCLQRIVQYTGIVIRKLEGAPKDAGAPAAGAEVRVQLPESARIGLPLWSYDGKRLAFARDLPDGVELWVADAATGAARAVGSLHLNDVLGPAFEWSSDNRHLLVRAIPEGRGAAPAAPRVPVGPDVEETAGKRSRMATYQDLLKTAHDDDLFEHYARNQILLVDADAGTARPIGAPGLHRVVPSPDDRFLMVTNLLRPFSHRVPWFYFARSVEVWTAAGEPVRTLAELPISDEVPQQGVPTGAREMRWEPLEAATLLWAEAMDGGDPLARVPYRDRLLTLAAPFGGEPREVLKLPQRLDDLDWTAKRATALITEFDRDRRWRSTYLVDFAQPKKRLLLFDLSVNDAYKDPGSPVSETRPDGRTLMLQDGDWIYLSGRGSTESGDRPFLDRMNLKTFKKERLFRCDESSYESFVSFAGSSRARILTRRETPAEPPNFYSLDLEAGQRAALTDFRNPAPQLARVQKQLLKYRRADGVPLSGYLFLPPDYQPGTHLPLVLWAYPLEFSDAGTAGQVRGSANTFTLPRGASQLFFVTQGYAVLNDATMPVIGDPETMNDTYIDQVVSSARAAIDTLDTMGIVDRRRVCVGGHSYGAFMTANLLAHSDLFAAGIARSGAYNRSLTPFGFQSERRSYWEATELYTKISPFTYAHKIDEPLLLIHGEADNNAGTFPLQSERLFEAIRANGGTARLVLLPFEAHGYRARESNLHVLAEMFEWADKFVKNRPEAEATRRSD